MTITKEADNSQWLKDRTKRAEQRLRDYFDHDVAEILINICKSGDSNLANARDALFDAVDVARIPTKQYREKPVYWKTSPSEATIGMCLAANDKFTVDYELAAEIWYEMQDAAPDEPKVNTNV